MIHCGVLFLFVVYLARHSIDPNSFFLQIRDDGDCGTTDGNAHDRDTSTVWNSFVFAVGGFSGSVMPPRYAVVEVCCGEVHAAEAVVTNLGACSVHGLSGSRSYSA